MSCKVKKQVYGDNGREDGLDQEGQSEAEMDGKGDVASFGATGTGEIRSEYMHRGG